MYGVKQIARWFIEQIDTDAGETLTPLKIQKLLYYAQAWNLALHDEPLFDENIEAWAHGPVIPSIYHELKDFTYHSIDKLRFESESTDFDETTLDLLEDIKTVYGRYDAKYLEELTHQETPWKATRGGLSLEERCNRQIDRSLMATFYKEMQEA